MARSKKIKAGNANVDSHEDKPSSTSASTSATGFQSLLNPSDVTDPAAPPNYVVELSKSARAICKKCDEKIANKIIRVGVLVGR